MTRRRLAVPALLFLLVASAAPASAQSFWERARDAAKSTIQSGVDAVKKDVQRRSSDAISAFMGDSTATPEAQTARASGVLFEPGATTAFELGGDPGTLPGGLHVWGGAFALTDDGALEATESGAFDVVLEGPMPDAFTVEFDLVASGATPFIQISVASEAGEPAGESYVLVDAESGLALGSASGGEYVSPEIVGADEIAVRFAVRGTDATLFLGDDLVASIADADFGQDARLQFVVDGIEDVPVVFYGLRVATD